MDVSQNNKRVEPILSTHLHSIGCKLGIPISGTFELTARCNFNCKMCYVHLHQDPNELEKKEISADKWLDLASDARDAGMMFLLLTGGEPFLRRDFSFIYEQLSKMGILVSINTNASLYNEELRDLFKRFPPSRLNVTLYGSSEETYSKLCGNPSYERVINNLRLMRDDNLQVKINASLTPYNIDDIRDIHEMAKELQMHVKAATYMYPPVRVDGCVGQNVARFSPQEAGEKMAIWHSINEDKEQFLYHADALKSGITTTLDESCADPEQEGILCRAGRSSFWVTWDGRMLPCGTMDIESSYPFETGFEEAWERVKQRSSEIRLPIECATCKNKSQCGACASICKCETGAFDCKPTYMCDMTEAKIRKTLEIAQRMRENEN